MFGRIQSITYPRYIAQIIFLSFINLHEDIHGAVIIRFDAVFYNHGIAITQLVVLIDDQLFVCLEVFFHELLGTEQVEQFILFVGLLHDAFQLLGCDRFITNDGDFMHFYLLFFVDINIHDYLVFVGYIVFL